MQRTLRLELEAIPILLANSATGGTALKNPHSLHFVSKADGLFTVTCAKTARGRQAAWGDSSGFTEGNWHCLQRLPCRELMHLDALVASLTGNRISSQELTSKGRTPTSVSV